MKAFYVMFVVFAVLLFAAPIASAQDGWPGCPWGAAYDPMVHGYVAGVLQPARCQCRRTQDCRAGGPGPSSGASRACPWPVAGTWPELSRPDCLSTPAAALAMPEPASCRHRPRQPQPQSLRGLAASAPSSGAVRALRRSASSLDPLLDPLALACLSQSVPAAKAASKPAGLAAPAPPAQMQFGPCGAGESPDPLTLACLR